MVQSDLLKTLCEDDDEYKDALDLLKKGWPKNLLIKYLRDYGSLPEEHESPEDLPFWT